MNELHKGSDQNKKKNKKKNKNKKRGGEVGGKKQNAVVNEPKPYKEN